MVYPSQYKMQYGVWSAMIKTMEAESWFYLNRAAVIESQSVDVFSRAPADLSDWVSLTTEQKMENPDPDTEIRWPTPLHSFTPRLQAGF